MRVTKGGGQTGSGDRLTWLGGDQKSGASGQSARSVNVSRIWRIDWDVTARVGGRSASPYAVVKACGPSGSGLGPSHFSSRPPAPEFLLLTGLMSVNGAAAVWAFWQGGDGAGPRGTMGGMSVPARTGPHPGPITPLHHTPYPERLRERFWGQVAQGVGEGCWLWMGGTGNSGYGLFRLGPRKVGAHRVAWMLTHGELPPSELHVCHTCDTPLCVRPEHLFLGSHSENMRDASHKGRKKGRGGRTGEGNGRARLSATTVIRLRALSHRYGLDTELARLLGVSVSAVHLARTGQTWKSLPMPGATGWEAAVAALRLEIPVHANLAGKAGPASLLHLITAG